MEKKIDISVVLASYNEESNLDRCLKSVANWAQEIVIVDGGSTDGTLAIATKYHVRIIKTDNPPIFHINKQKALNAAKSKWILQLDADEVVTPELAQEIRAIVTMSDKEIDERPIEQNLLKLFKRHQALIEERDGKIGSATGSYTAFFVPRRNFFLGHPLKYSGTYPDGVIRLVQKDKARFPAKSVHEQIEIEGRVGWLYHDLLHFSNQTLAKYFYAADKYTNLLAKDLKSSGNNKLLLFIEYVCIKPPLTFLSLFFRYKGILDGWYGFLFDLFSAEHFPVAYFKYLKLTKHT